MVKIKSPVNKYINIYINNYVRPFCDFIKSKYVVEIKGLSGFMVGEDGDVSFLLSQLRTYGFEVIISAGQNTIDEVEVEYVIENNAKSESFEYKIENLISTIWLSSKTGISLVGILAMQIISQIICKAKIMYKAIILDLDDTLWKGTLAEDGIDIIKQNLSSEDGMPFVMFMRFIRETAKELGLYVAICSRNDTEKVRTIIDKLSEEEFPLKGQIDCIVANYNNKSENIKCIAKELSILTNACVFIDDNKLVRDEVRQNLPEVFVPEWNNHEDLLILLLSCCIFDRFELSLISRNRKRLRKVLQEEKKKNGYLPQLFVEVCDDIDHEEAMRLYAKSNQFRFSDRMDCCEGCKSLVFKIYRDNGEDLGICSAITYEETERSIQIFNWAISCRYFEIGLEEFILMHIISLAGKRVITFAFINTGYNEKAIALIKKYSDNFIKNDKNEDIIFRPNASLISNMQLNTNLRKF